MPYVRGINIRTKVKPNKKQQAYLQEVGYAQINDDGSIGDLPILVANILKLAKSEITPRPTSRYELEQEVENLLPDMDIDDFDDQRLVLPISL